MAMKKEIVAKVLIIGEAKVGKTSILTRYTEGVFTETLIPTLGIDYRLKRIEIEGAEIKLQIWDTAGQERFRAITQNFYKGAMGIILVFDLTDINSFNTLMNWLDSINQFSGQDVCKIILGNKCDLPQAVPQQDIDILCKQANISFFTTSAKINKGIDDAFNQITRQIKNKFFRNINNESKIFETTNNGETQKGNIKVNQSNQQNYQAKTREQKGNSCC